MAIASQQVTGTAGGTTGDIRTADTFTSDQFSHGAGDLDAADRGAVGRAGGAAAEQRAERLPGHLLLEFRQPGADAVQADRGAAGRSSAARYSSGPLAAGTQLELTAVGSTISFLVNGVQRISVTDTSFTGGAPGIMAYGSATADNWSGGDGGVVFGGRDGVGAVRDGGAAG